MKRVEAASGSHYSAHKEQGRKFEPIAPVGTNYKPIGKPDINELRRGAPRDVIGVVVCAILLGLKIFDQQFLGNELHSCERRIS